MADERHVIDIILRARDEMGGALNEAMSGLSKYQREIDGARERTEAFSRDADKTSDALRVRLHKSLEGIQQQLKGTETQVEKTTREMGYMSQRAQETGDNLKSAAGEADRYGKNLRRAENDVMTLGKRLDDLNTKLDEAEKRGSKGWATRYANEIKEVSAELARATDRQKKHSEAMDDQVKRVESLAARNEEFAKTMEKRNALLEKEEQQLKRNADQYRRAIDDSIKAREKLNRAEQNQGADPMGVAQLRRQLSDREREVKAHRQRVEETLKRTVDLKVGADTSEATRELAEFETFKSAVGSDITLNVDADTAGAIAALTAVLPVKAAVEEDINIDVDVDTSAAIAQLAALNRSLDSHRHNIAQFDNAIRGLIAFMGLGLFQPLLTGAIGLAGALTAVASSAIQAGAAIGVGLTSGLAQATPMVGLFIGAMFRVAAVMEAVKQQALMQKQQFGEAAKGGAEVAGAADQVAAAQERLIQSQQDLTKARFDARRELQDLILAEREAALAARGAALSQEDAHRQLRQSIQSGDVFGVSEDQLGVDESRLNKRQADIAASRASQDLNRFQQGGSPGVQAATQAVEDAQRALDQANRSAKEAGDTMTSAGNNLAFFLSQLSEAERGMYQAIMRIKKTWEENMRPITDLLIGSFTFAIDRVNKVLQNPEFLGAARKLAGSMSEQMDRITREFTSPKWINFFNEMMKEAARNIKPMTENFLQLANVFRRIADAAQPVWRLLIRLISQAVDDFDKWVGHGKKLNDFMREASKHMKAWWELGRSVLRLFLEIIDSASGTGLKAVKDLTDAINEAAEWIDGHDKKMAKFWRGVRVIMNEVGKVLIVLGREMIKAFDPETVKAMGQLFRRILIPAFADSVRLLGTILKHMMEFAKENPWVEQFLKIAVAGTIASKVLGTFLGMLGGLVKIASTAGQWVLKILPAAFVTRVSTAVKALGAMRFAILGISAPIGVVAAAVAALVAAFVFLAHKFGVLDDIMDAFRKAGQEIWKAIGPPIEDIIDSVEDIAKALGLAGGEAEGLGKVFKWLFVTVVEKGVIPIIEELGKIMAKVFGGFAKIVKGAFDIVAGILTGDFGRIWDGIKSIVSGIADHFMGVVRAITWPFRFAFGIIKDILGEIGEFFGNVAGDLVGVFEDIKSPLIDVLNFIIDEIINRIPGVQLDLIDSDKDESGVNIREGSNRSMGRRGASRSGSISDRYGGYAEGGRVGFAKGGRNLQPTSMAGSVADKISGLVSKVAEADFGFLPDWMKGLARFIKDKVIDFIKSKAGGVVDDITGFANPFGGGGPNIQDLFSATGGRIHGPGGVDTIPAWLTRDEFVVTPHGESLLERMTGVPGILDWLAGSQRPAQGFARGGRAGFAKGGRGRQGRGEGGGEGGAGVPQFTEEDIERWEKGWEVVKETTAKGTKFIAAQIEQMAKQTDKTLARLVNRATQDFEKMSKAGVQAANRLAAGFKQAFGELQNVVFQGLDYVTSQTDKVLEAFNVKEVGLNIERPKEGGKAGGGFIGQPGERGGDTIPAWLGRGEAVLNWAHQKMVDPALRSMYGFGLSDMFGRTSAEHGASRSGGFAGGGMVHVPGDPNLTGGRDMVSPSVVGLAEWLVKRFNLEIGYAYDPGGGHQSPGHNVTGTALDIVPGPGGGWEGVNAAVRWAVQEGLTVYYDGQFGSINLPPHGEGHHAHIELKAGVGPGGGIMDEIKKVLVEGTAGPFKDMAQAMIDEVREAANEYLREKTGDNMEGVEIGGGSIPRMIYEIGKALGAPQNAILAAYMAAMVESGDPSLQTNPDYGDSSSRGIYQLLSTTAAAMGIDPLDLNEVINAFYLKGFWGKGGAIELAREGYSPGEIAQMVEGSAFPERYFAYGDEAHQYLTRYSHAKGGYAGGQPHEADVGEEFATGGEVGSRSPKGAAVPIVAHAGEWVVNESQQSRLAGALGATVGQIRDMLGFAGGPGSFAGGGVISGSMRDVRQADVEYEYFRAAMRRGGGLDERIRKFFDKLVGEGGVFDQLAEQFEKLTTILSTRIARATVEVNRHGRVIGRDLHEGGLLNRELNQLRIELRFLTSEQGALTQALRRAQSALKRAKRQHDQDAAQVARAAINNIRERLLAINQQLADAQLAVLDKMEERMALEVDRINRRAETALSGMNRDRDLGSDLRRSINETMGWLNDIPALAAESLNVLEQQRIELREMLRKAEKRGNNELARDIRSQLADLQSAIAEATAEMIVVAQDEITRVADREQFAIDIRNRMADVQAGFGGNEAAEVLRGSALGAQRNSIQDQITSYQALIAAAISQGFGPGVVDPLQDALDDLTTQLEENNLATYENTIAIRQATIDNILNRQGFLGGVGDSLQGIVETLGSITGTVNVASLIQIVQRAIDQLTATGENLRQQMDRFVAENLGSLPAAAQSMLTTLEGLHGQDFVNAVMGLNLNEIVDSLGGPASPLAQQFQSLLQAIIDNESALWQNTEELQNLNQQNQIQQFTSTAWQWFRQAIFTGMGGLLPEYAAGTPFFAEGGDVFGDGARFLHDGEFVVPARFASMAKALVNAGSMAGMMSDGGINADLFGPAATGSAATIQGGLAGGLRGASSALEYRKLREALLHQQQHIEVNTYGRESSDDTYLASRIAFESKIPVS